MEKEKQEIIWDLFMIAIVAFFTILMKNNAIGLIIGLIAMCIWGMNLGWDFRVAQLKLDATNEVNQ